MVSLEFPSIVTALAEESILMIRRTLFVLDAAAGRVTVNAALVASQVMISSVAVAVYAVVLARNVSAERGAQDVVPDPPFSITSFRDPAVAGMVNVQEAVAAARILVVKLPVPPM